MKNRFSLLHRLLLLLLFAMTSGGTNAQTTTLALTPPMGFNNYGVFFPSEFNHRTMADAMAANGMRDAGYQYVNIDGGWWGDDGQNRVTLWPTDGTTPAGIAYRAGDFRVDPGEFPRGMKYLADYVHAKGLKLGFYTDPYISQGREQQHANLLAAWGIDYLKDDGYSINIERRGDLVAMRDALANTGQPIVLSINSGWHGSEPELANLYRTGNDINALWETVMANLESNNRPTQQSPGHWNDPDMIYISGRPVHELEAQMSLWAVMAAPLLVAEDVRSMTLEAKAVILNTELIAVDQDALGKQGSRVRDDGDAEVWSRPLADGSRAVVLLNRGPAAATIRVNWSELGLSSGTSQVRDLLKHVNLGGVDNAYSATVGSHSVALLKVVGGTTAIPDPAPTWAVAPAPQLPATPLNKTGWRATTASSSDNDPGAILDNDVNTRWLTYRDFDGAFMDIDMGTPQTFNQIVVDAAKLGANPPAYEVYVKARGLKVLVSTDGQNWGNAIAAVATGPSGTTLVKFAPQTARYLRLVNEIIYSSPIHGTNWGIDELYVYNTGVSSGNQAPTVSLTAPAANTSVAVGTAVTLTATAADSDGSVAKVEFYQGTAKLGESTASPYVFSPYVFAWTPTAAGTYALTAKATDNQGATTTSAPVALTVTAAAPPSGGDPAGYVYCSNERERCVFTGPTDVAYGANGSFVYKSGLSGGCDCASAFFGSDPAPGLVKKCFTKAAAGPAPAAEFSGTYRLLARHSGQALDIAGASLADAAPAIQWPVNGGANQYWKIEATSGGTYKLTAQHSGKALGVSGSSTDDGAQVQQSADTGTPAQRWKIEPSSDGFYKLANQASGKCLDVAGVSAADGALVQQWAYAGGANQQWKLEQVAPARANALPAAGARFGAAALAVYPNPAREELTVRASFAQAGETTLSLADGLGRVVRQLPPAPAPAGELTRTLDLRGLPAGLYLLRVQQAGQTYARKVLIQY